MTKLIPALAAMLFAHAAVAETAAPIRVTLAAPVAQNGVVKAMATSWNCTGAACTGPAINGRFGDARGCREIAKVAGAVTAYVGARGELNADDLARCNKSAKTAN